MPGTHIAIKIASLLDRVGVESCHAKTNTCYMSHTQEYVYGNCMTDQHPLKAASQWLDTVSAVGTVLMVASYQVSDSDMVEDVIMILKAIATSHGRVCDVGLIHLWQAPVLGADPKKRQTWYCLLGVTFTKDPTVVPDSARFLLGPCSCPRHKGQSIWLGFGAAAVNAVDVADV